jgi:hypothetical protein
LAAGAGRARWKAAEAQPVRIHPVHRVRAAIAVQVQPAGPADGVAGQEAADGRVIPAVVEEVEAQVAVPVVAPASRVLEGGGVPRALALGLVTVGVEAEGAGCLAGAVGQVAGGAQPVFLEEAVRRAPALAQAGGVEPADDAAALFGQAVTLPNPDGPMTI